VSYVKGIARGRFFAETNADGIYVSRFDKDTLLYAQNRAGIKLRDTQIYWNANATVDIERQYWANTVETGPGVRFKFENSPLMFSVNLLRGAYLINQGNPHGANYNDLRIGVWYAFTR
jgi:hypothetical protein